MTRRPSWDETWLSVAVVISKRSRCPTGVGCVIVGKDNRIVQTGYTGPPSHYLAASRNMPDDVTCLEYCERQWKRSRPQDRSSVDPEYGDCPTVHAELNAIAYADRTLMEGGVIYVSSSPCFSCAKVIANCGVERVAWLLDAEIDANRDPEKSRKFLNQCGIKVNIVTV